MTKCKILILLALFMVTSAARGGAVRSVDFSETPEMRELAGQVTELGNEVYPKIVRLLTEDAAKTPSHFDVVFRKKLDGGAAGSTSNTTISLSAAWFAEHASDIGCVVHEMAHVAQHYPPGAPSHWVEGIADYARHTLGYTNRWSMPECSAEFPHYTAGYWCASAFLMYVESRYASRLIRQLDAALKQGAYSDDLFVQSTGKSLDELWSEFQGTAAYRPSAAQAEKARQLRTSQEKSACAVQMRQIQQAIQSYQRDHHDLPDWLLDLVPKYIGDTNVLICPVARRTKWKDSSGAGDSRLPNGYVYQFNAGKVPWYNPGGNGPTMKQFKLRQKEMIGVGIPILVCDLHGGHEYISYDGRTFESQVYWEYLFTNRVIGLGDLLPQTLFPMDGRKSK